MDSILSQLSTTLPQAKSLNELARPILQMLGEATGLESTFLTSIDLEKGVQQTRYSRNVGDLNIPEGMSVPWSDTLCKRALDDGVMYTDDVPGRWGDSDAARALGIKTYLSSPIRNEQGELLGTLCACSAARRPLHPETEGLLHLFSNLVGMFVQREQLVQQLQTANERLTSYALTDALTGLPNRRALYDELERLMSRGRRGNSSVIVGMLDLDGFKAINDTYGHQAGDLFLQEIARRLMGGIRSSDLVGRMGGDEFLFVGPGPKLDDSDDGDGMAVGDAAPVARTVLTVQSRLIESTTGRYRVLSHDIDYGGASAGVVAIDPRELSAEAAVRLADRRMYEIKRGRKEGVAEIR
ncbi:sensor domain-containing diguanylate cyclase [Bordetella sp. N]|uniref:sensor domain-containing diguanylate cyclase n=1 Tax=Bordetella sp. N TaxID=1746199 RepID=UPI000709BB87|nr:sensor domain-containing diguanylate cyclase [Bordetella sp. N]ALM82467.1 diguanylate cyclase [Bordetella sp. N]